MYAYEGRFQIAFEQRNEKRRRWTSAVRGLLRCERFPRLTALGLLLVCAIWSVFVDLWLLRIGFEFRPYRWSTSVLVAWPVFMMLLRWRAGVEARHCDVVPQWDYFIRCDDQAEQCKVKHQGPPTRKSRMQEAMWCEINRKSGEAIGRSMGGGGVLYAVFLAAITIGLWLAWDLICRAPGLLADTIIDGVLVLENPEMARRMACERWKKNLASGTFSFCRHGPHDNHRRNIFPAADSFSALMPIKTRRRAGGKTTVKARPQKCIILSQAATELDVSATTPPRPRIVTPLLPASS